MERLLGLSVGYISRLKSRSAVSDPGHGFCIEDEVKKYISDKQKRQDEEWMLKKAKEKELAEKKPKAKRKSYIGYYTTGSRRIGPESRMPDSTLSK